MQHREDNQGGRQRRESERFLTFSVVVWMAPEMMMGERYTEKVDVYRYEQSEKETGGRKGGNGQRS